MQIPLPSYRRKGVVRHAKHLVDIFHGDMIKALQVWEQIPTAQPVPLNLAWICDDVASYVAAGHGSVLFVPHNLSNSYLCQPLSP